MTQPAEDTKTHHNEISGTTVSGTRVDVRTGGAGVDGSVVARVGGGGGAAVVVVVVVVGKAVGGSHSL